MRDFLIDLVRHTQGLGFIDTVKVVTDDTNTNVTAIADDKSVVIMATFDKNEDLTGTFGMPNLSKLNTILNLPVYDEHTQIAVDTKDGNPVSINFKTAAGDFSNDYRLQAESVIKERVPDVAFKGVKWDVTITPSRAAVQRMKYQSQVNNDETVFVVRTVGDKLEFVFGDPSTHAGNFVFAEGIAGKLSRQWSWPIAQALAILSQSGDMTVSFSDGGAMQITVQSGIAEYVYILPAQSK